MPRLDDERAYWVNSSHSAKLGARANRSKNCCAVKLPTEWKGGRLGPNDEAITGEIHSTAAMPWPSVDQWSDMMVTAKAMWSWRSATPELLIRHPQRVDGKKPFFNGIATSWAGPR